MKIILVSPHADKKKYGVECNILPKVGEFIVYEDKDVSFGGRVSSITHKFTYDLQFITVWLENGRSE